MSSSTSDDQRRDDLPRDLAGQIVLVTGAASGIGRETALVMAERGASAVALVDRDADTLDEVVEEVAASGAQPVRVRTDLGDLPRCASIVDDVITETGRLDAVVNNAAIARESIRCIDYDTIALTEDLTVNLMAGFVIARDAARHLVAAGRPGSIVFVASINALGAGAGSAGYCASKAGVLGLMRVMAVELGEAQIRVNAVSPGPADTPRSRFRVGEERMRELRERFDEAPLSRLASPRDIADAIAFLCSDQSRYITGHNLVVDGGLTATVYHAQSGDDVATKEGADAAD